MTFLTSYFDDSGSDEAAPVTALGGPVMDKDDSKAFEVAWPKLLHQYSIPMPLHMTEFVRPHGKHCGMYPEMKIALFSAVAKIINSHKLYSLSVVIPQPAFRMLVPEQARKELIEPYALAFFCAVLVNQGVAGIRRNKQTVMAYLIDHGSSCSDQLAAAHKLLLNRESKIGKHRHTAAMGFDTDDRVSALQAADVIAWSARRRQIGELTSEFDPLKELLVNDPASRRKTHVNILIPQDGIEMFAKPIRNWIFATGEVPSFEDFVKSQPIGRSP